MVKLFYQSLAVALSVYCGGYLLEADALALDSEMSKQETAPALPVSTTSDEVLHVKKWAGFQAPRLIVGVDKSINKACPFFRGQMRDQIVTQVPKQDIEAASVVGNTPAPNNVWLERFSVEACTREEERRGAGTQELMDINLFSSSVSPGYPNRIAPASKSSQQTTQIAQVNSVSELTDVQPTDWAFGALQSLVERYGCIEGYPNSTYRGNRAMSRYEFAAGLNKCLEQINELIAIQQSQGVSKEDLVTLERLQKDFAAELKNLRGRVDALEANTAILETQQFSTTTKLSGRVLTYLGNAWGENAGKANNTALAYRANLNLNTSFTGKDNLFIGLEAINLRRLDTATEFPRGRLSGSTDETRFLGSSISGDGDLGLNGLQYRFPIGDKFLVFVNAFSSDRFLTEPITPLSNAATGAVTYFGSINPFDYPIGQQTGIGLQWTVSNWLNLDLAAAAETNTNDPSVGLFGGGGYGVFARPVITLGKLKLSFPFAHFYSPESGSDTITGSNAAKLKGAGPVVGNSYDFSFNYRITPQMSFGGSIAYIAARTLGEGTKGNADLWDYRFNLVFFDVGKKGNLAALIFGMQPRLTGTSNAALAQAIGLPDGQRSDRNAGFHIEAFYTHRLNDNITITPGIVWLTAPNHDERNPDVIVGVLRTAFSF